MLVIPRTSQCIVTRQPFSSILIASRREKSHWLKILSNVGVRLWKTRIIIQIYLILTTILTKLLSMRGWQGKCANFMISNVRKTTWITKIMCLQDKGYAILLHSQNPFLNLETWHKLRLLVWAKLCSSMIIFWSSKIRVCTNRSETHWNWAH